MLNDTGLLSYLELSIMPKKLGTYMPLIEIWSATPKTVLGMLLPAVVNIATNGNILKDGSEGSKDFRQYLTEIESGKLAEYATFCIENAFTDSGQVLQDVVNEIGRRLGFNAENGRYRGVRNDIGYDGIWTADGQSLVIEVKTTDAYTIKLDVIAKYRDRLVEENRIPQETPILIVIGRNDTSSLEAQVRGSRYAWSMRIVGIDALIKLMEVNLSTTSESVTEKIHTILRPFEYTRIDQIVDVVFTTAEDKENEIEIDDTDEKSVLVADTNVLRQHATPQFTPKSIIELKKSEAIERLNKKFSKVLVKKKNSLFSDRDDEVHAAVAISKKYTRAEDFYWYAYHEQQRKFLSESTIGLMVYGMSDTDIAFAIPYAKLEELRDKLNSTIREDGREYKHIFIHQKSNQYVLKLKGGDELGIDQYQI